MAENPSSPNLRGRVRDAMRDEVARVAVSLFAEHTFEGVTTVEIAKAAGISPRSFFRYFENKEDVLLVGLTEAGERVAHALRERPETEPAWEALRCSFRILVEDPVYPVGEISKVAEIILNTPSVQAREFSKQRQWEALLVPEVVRRLPPALPTSSASPEGIARAVVGAAMACLRVATEGWLRSGGSADMLMLLDELMTSVRPA